MSIIVLRRFFVHHQQWLKSKMTKLVFRKLWNSNLPIIFCDYAAFLVDYLVNFLLESQSIFHGLQNCIPWFFSWFWNVLKANGTSTRVLVVHEFLSMGSLLVRACLEEFGESMHCLVLTSEKVSLWYQNFL